MHRKRIFDEVKTRLAEKFPDAVFLETQSYDTARMPSFAVWEDDERSEKHHNETKKGYRVYNRILPLEIEFCFVETDESQQKELGRNKIQEIREAIEPVNDFWFKEKATGEKLVIDYKEVAASVALIYTPIVVAVVRYEFEYADAI